ncbi:baseplate J/gp47 family protein [Achromobacter sp. AONIH1]|uniref:baseplate J/gp47 family protein n=1 Tax=Achromobacter sp. AONIH1 TaxID=1758194 RepID=UPI001319CE20|nr:baseplate J/gp47 family protein [Achromobacter sp. AONIH1]
MVSADIVSGLPNGQALLRYSNVRVLGDVQAGLAHLHYGFLDGIARDAVPWTARGEYLAAWGALKNVYLKPATGATGAVQFDATPGAILDEGAEINAASGVAYRTVQAATASATGRLTASVAALLPGVSGNCPAGTVMSLGVAVPGVTSQGRASSDLTGGANTEDQEAFRVRVMDAYRAPPRGGAELDYVTWAKSVPGVTRAWCLRNGYGAGTVVVYIMLDAAQAGHDGFPVGQDGVATDEPRGVPAIGDQLTVANAFYPLQPVTALVYVCAPRRNSLTLTLEGLSGASLSTRAAIAQAVAGVLMLSGSPNRAVVSRTDIVTAIRAVPQTAGFVLSGIVGRQGGVETEYPGNITSDQGFLPILENIIYRP